ncbi:DNA polymerase-3 subunit epsilon [Geodermatophilus bullaregiensis]|uniref:3'-5' exonuclease n=1 Tax=Geodermatophilus bullaregiensis TaxID=1564160 RepID=UPI001958F05D|nr:3'-5' exonuclease [Geodermatophilus bullaregiensis]MBM7805197.1 DNA polymerase-3 subunit epsilon [Geodermatophilus bullaregiensis]
MRRPLARRPAGAAARAYRDAARVPAGTPWREASFCVVDLELTGLDPRRHEIVSWGAVCVEGGRVVCGTAAEGLVRPERGVPEESVRVHGLRPADLAGAPSLPEAVDGLLEVMTGRVLVAHAAWVERGFLGRALAARGMRLRTPVLDTCALGRLWLAGTGTTPPAVVSLAGLAEALGLPSHRPHEASGDALTTAQVFVALATLLEDGGAETVGTLAGAEARLRVH